MASFKPVAVHVGVLDCPKCRLRMEESAESGLHLICPECNSQSAQLSEYEEHVQLVWDGGGLGLMYCDFARVQVGES